jgi:hypothetical protein
MAQVFLTTTHPSPFGSCEILMESARDDPFGAHRPVDDPETADIIIFAESIDTGYSLVHARRHPLTRRFREKTFVLAEHDLVIPFLPGVFTSLPARFYSPARARTSCYVWTYPNPYVHPGPFPDRPYLFSFAGDIRTAPMLRGRVLGLEHPEAYLEDTSGRVFKAFYGDDEEAKRVFQSDYGTMLRNSLFVLCPRGDGPSTVRLYETMKSGRAPIIVSDDWVPPAGPDWDAFSIRVREADVERLPEILEARRGDAGALGLRAREAWEQWFAPEVLFHRTVEACLAIRSTRRLPERFLRFGVWKQVARAPYHRIFVREMMLEWAPARALLARRAAARRG